MCTTYAYTLPEANEERRENKKDMRHLEHSFQQPTANYPTLPVKRNNAACVYHVQAGSKAFDSGSRSSRPVCDQSSEGTAGAAWLRGAAMPQSPFCEGCTLRRSEGDDTPPTSCIPDTPRAQSRASGYFDTRKKISTRATLSGCNASSADRTASIPPLLFPCPPCPFPRSLVFQLCSTGLARPAPAPPPPPCLA